MNSNDLILSDPQPAVIVGELADSSVNLIAQPWIEYKNHPAIAAYMTEQAKVKFDEANISIPYPQTDVHLFNASA